MCRFRCRDGGRGLATSADVAEVVRRPRGGGAAVLYRACDVSDEAQCEGLIAATVERFGRIDVLVSDAGTGFVM